MIPGDLVVVIILIALVTGLIYFRRKSAAGATEQQELQLADQLDTRTRELNKANQIFLQKARDFEFMADAMPQIVWSATSSGLIDYHNKRWHEYTGFSPEQTHNWGWVKALHPDDVEPSQKLWSGAIASGQPLELEYRVKRASDGVYRWFLARALPVINAQGKVEKWFGTATDVDDQKKAQELLEIKVIERTRSLYESESKIRALFDNSFNLIGLLDLDGRLAEVNRTALEFWNLSADQVVGQYFWQAPIWGNDQEAMERMQAAILEAASGKAVRLENRHPTPDGIRYVDGSVKPVFDQEHKVIWLVAEARDVTAERASAEALREQTELLRQMTEQLSVSNKDLRQFAYVASHDLQEPLRTVVGFSGLLNRNCGDQLDDDGRKYLDIMTAAVLRMQQLIKDLLTYVQIETHGHKLIKLDLSLPIDNAIIALKEEIAATQAKITYDPMPVVVGDFAQLASAFRALFDNSLKYRGVDAPRLHIKVAEEADLWRLTVSDNGIGIKPAYAEKVFVIFQRLHGRDEYSGTGIGLSFCKRIIERHGGTITLGASSADQPGATFVITFPRI